MANPSGSSTNRRQPRVMRKRTSVIIVLTALSLIAALVVAALNAEGREVSRASSNDGGAWLINREYDVVGHRNRSAGELSSYVRIPDSPRADVHQSGNLVVVHDPSTNRLIEVDTRSFNEDLEPTILPDTTSVHAVERAVVFTRAEPLTVWRVPEVELATLQDLALQPEVHRAEGAGTVAVRPDGAVVVVEHATMQLQWLHADGTSSEPIPTGIDPEVQILDATIVDDTAVLLLANETVVFVGSNEIEHVVDWSQLGTDHPLPSLLQQPSGAVLDSGTRSAMFVGAVTGDGRLLTLHVDRDQSWVELRGSLDGADPLPPIVHEGCVYGVVTEPAVLGASCEQFVSRDLVGAGQELRLRLVNGWVWVNDLDDGGTWVTSDSLLIESLNDWSQAAPTQADDQTLEDEGGDATDAAETVVIENPDALGEIRDSDDYNPTEANIPPIPTDDAARTRVDRPIVVDVLANDTDLNNDILTVAGVNLTAGDAVVRATADLRAVQVTPGPGFIGVIQFTYEVSDGRSEPVAASVVIDVLSNEQSNRAPEAVTDVVATAPGNSSTIDVLRNDFDPDGDALALRRISTTTGTLRWDPSGQVTFTPDTTTAAGWIELPYVVVDDLGAEANGVLRVEIRDRGANQEPDARNDQATTVVGRPVAIDLLLNDSDPDGDPLTVSSRPRLLSPEDATVRTSTTPDGEFIFEADEPGIYLFEYAVNDGAEGGSESDTARIRIDVAPADDNEPPIAVRDDVVIAAGDTRTVYVLDNDGDPDGDVISIVDWSSSPGLQITEYKDDTGHVGFQVTATPGARRPTFSYSISDGVNEPVSAAVVVSLVDPTALDQPPFAVDDVVEVRAGRTVQSVDVLGNDFDPEGGSLRIVRVGDVPDAQVLIAADAQTLSISVPRTAVSSFTIPYDIEDAGGNRAAAVIRVQLISPDAPNRPPIARADEARTSEGEPISVAVLRNDSDPDGDAIALEGVADQPQHGSVGVSGEGVLQYTPDPLFSGTDVFSYSIVDASGDRAFGDVFVGVMDRLGVNLPPIANDDSYVLAGTPVATPLEVRANDFDPEGDPLRVVDVTPATVGSVAIDRFGRVEYLPPPRLAAATVVTFDYVIADSAGNRARATVSIELDAYEDATIPTPPPLIDTDPTPEPTPTPDPLEVVPTPTPTPTPDPEEENQPPVAVNDERGPVAVGSSPRITVLDNDYDPDGDRADLTIVEVERPGRISGRAIVIDDIGESTEVEYTIEDAFGAQATAVARVLVIENQAPVVAPLVVETAFETPIALSLGGQATDADDDDLFFICCEDRRNGEVSEVTTGPNRLELVFTPDDGFVGRAAFSYRVDDQEDHQTSGVVTIEVLPPDNRPPIVVENTVQVPQGETVSVDLTQLSQDPDGDDLTRTIESLPGGGIDVVIAGPTAQVSAPNDADVGPAGAFTYIVSDGVLETEGSVSVVVLEGANEPPVVSSTSVQVPAAASTTVDLASLTTETDLGDSVTWSLDAATHPPLVVQLFGSLLQISAPADAVDASVSVGFTATDTRGATGSSTVSVTVTEPIEPDPVAIDDAIVAGRGETTTIDVLANDVDPLGEGLSILTASGSWGTVTVAGAALQFAPGDRVGTATLQYTLEDAAGRQSTANVAVDVVGVPDRPAPPSADAESRQVTIGWTTPAANGREITGYVITANTGATRSVGVQNSYVWSGLVNGDTYEFTVTAENDVGPSPASEPSLSVVPNQVPERPSPPEVTFGDRELEVVWEAPNNEGSPIIGYELEIGPAPAVEEIGTTTRFVWRGLTNGQNYRFRVRAQNAAGFSEYSDLSLEEHPAARPDPPTIGETQLGNQSGSLIVNWYKPIDNGDTVIEYEIRSSEGGVNAVAGADTLSYEWSNLTNGTEIDFQVRARNRAGWSDWSGRSIGVPPCGLPSAPANVTATRGDGRAQVNWAAAADNGCPITGYTISTLTGAVQNSSAPGHNFTGLVNGTSYQFEVRATNERGVGPPSAPSNAVIPAGPPLCANPSNMTANVTAARAIDLAWTPAIDNGSPIIEYTIGTISPPIATGSSATNRTVSGLTNGTNYSFSVTARNDVGVSAQCGTVSATTWDVPTPVTIAALTFDPETETVTARASGGRTLDGATGRRYTWTVSGPAANPTQLTGTGTVTEPWTFQVTEDGVYTVNLTAENAAGPVTAPPRSVTVTLADPPAEVVIRSSNLSAQNFARVGGAGPLGTSVFIDISAPDDGGAPITEYEWESKRVVLGPDPTDSGVAAFQSAASTRWRFGFLGGYSSHWRSVNRGFTATWEIRVRAVNSEGPGPWSPWTSIRPAPPDPYVRGTRTGPNCSPTEPSCDVSARMEVYGLKPNEVYDDITASSGSMDANCTTLVTEGTGAVVGDVTCRFDTRNGPPGAVRVRIDGVSSNNMS